MGQRDGQEHEGQRNPVRGPRVRIRTAPITHGYVYDSTQKLKVEITDAHGLKIEGLGCQMCFRKIWGWGP